MSFHIGSFSTEISVLLLSILLGLVHLGAQGLLSDFENGLKWAFGPRDETVKQSKLGSRLERASKNFQETFPLMMGILIIIEITSRSSELTRNLSLIWLFSRIIYLPAYAFGSILRSIVWVIGIICISILGATLLFG